MSKKGDWRDYIKEYREQFDMFDENKDGKIEVNEIKTMMRRLGQNPSNAQAQELMDKMDVDRDGKVTVEEFAKLMHNQPEPNDDELQESFNVFDRDGNGSLDKKELTYILTTMGEPLTNKEVDEIFRDFDLDGDGRINYKEFAALMKSQ